MGILAKQRLLVGLVLVSACLLPSGAEASIIGHTLRIEWEYTPFGGVFTSTTVAVVDPGVEWNPGSGVSSVDVADGVITIQNDTMGWSAAGVGGINGFRFIDVNGTIPAFSSFFLISIAGFPPPDAPSFVVTPDSILVNFDPTGGGNIGAGVGQLYTLGFTTDDAPDAVPEPASIVLLSAGLGLLGFRRRTNAR